MYALLDQSVLSVCQERDEEPVVKKLTSEPILVKEEHFGVPLEGSTLNRRPLHFPVPEIRYLVKEISVVWHLYGGKDFGGGALSSSPARSQGYIFGVGPLLIQNHASYKICVL